MILGDNLKAAQSAAASFVNRAVLQTLSAADIGTVEEPIAGFTSITRTVPTDWAKAIEVTRLVVGVARNMQHDYVRRARGAGMSWRALAGPLGIPTDDHDVSPAEAAFELVAGSPSMPFDRVYMSWTCTTCQQSVIDEGPYESHPSDNERGHAENCARHRREIRAYRIRVGD